MHRLYKALGALWSLAAAANCYADVNAWTSLGPDGGWVNKMAFNSSSPSTLYAIAVSGFYRSTDAGASWQLALGGLLSGPSDLVVDPSNPNRLYLAGANNPALYVSSDAGATLTALTGYPATEKAYHLQVSSDGATLYAAADANIYQSTDRGQSWRVRTPVVAGSPYGPVQQLLIDPNNVNVLYATIATSATNVGFFVSTDGALSWQLQSTVSAAAATFQALCITSDSSTLWAARGDGVWVSTNQGQTWTNRNFTQPADTLAFDPSNPKVVYTAVYTGSIYRSPDSGATWTDISGNISVANALWITVHPTQASQVWVAGINGLAETINTGASWNMHSSGIRATNVVQLGTDPGSDRVYVATASNGLYYSAAAASSLAPVNNAALQQLDGGTPYWGITAMHVQPGGSVYLSLLTGVARSADGGATWTALPFYMYTRNAVAADFASSPLAPSTILASAFDRGLYRSLDNGVTWLESDSGIPANSSVQQLLGSPIDANTFYALAMPPGGAWTIYNSSDAGVSWAPTTAQPPPGPAGLSVTIDPTNAKVLYAASSSHLYRSPDGGTSWATLAGAPANAVAVDPQHPNILVGLSGTSSGVSRSIDTGATWQPLLQGAFGPAPPQGVQIDPVRPYRVLIGTAYSGAYEISIEPDLALQVAAPSGPLPVGVPATWQYTITNNGPYHATGVSVSVGVTGTTTATSASVSAGQCCVSANTVSCSLGPVLTGNSATLTLTTTPSTAQSLKIDASVSADQPDSTPANNTTSTTSTVESLADLSVLESGPASGTQGQSATYILTVHNGGPNSASNVQLSYQLPGILSAMSATASAGSCTLGATVMCSLGDIAAGDEVGVSVTVQFATPGGGTAVATASTTTTETVSTNNVAHNDVRVDPPPAGPIDTHGHGGGGALSPFTLLGLVLGWLWRLRSHLARRRPPETRFSPALSA